MKYILTCIETYSRYLETTPLKSKNSLDIANFLLTNVFNRYGNPKFILSDQGTEFKNKLIENICNIMKTKKSCTSSYNPRCNGAVEKANGTVVLKLAKLCNGNFENWDEILPYATFAYNISKQSRLGFSPYEILFGKEYAYVENENEGEVEPICDFTKRIKDIRAEIHNIIMKDRNKSTHENFQRQKVDDLEINDYVLKKKLGTEIGSKLDEKWVGPMIIIKKSKTGNYHVKDLFNKVYSINRRDFLRINDDDKFQMETFGKEGGMWYKEPQFD